MLKGCEKATPNGVAQELAIRPSVLHRPDLETNGNDLIGFHRLTLMYSEDFFKTEG
jgi:hypothetical protein